MKGLDVLGATKGAVDKEGIRKELTGTPTVLLGGIIGLVVGFGAFSVYKVLKHGLK